MATVVDKESIDLKDVIAQVPFLSGLPDKEVIFLLTDSAWQQTLHEREYLYRQGDEAEAIYIILQGRMQQTRLEEERDGRTKIGPKITLRRELAAGDILGKYEMLYRLPFQTRARALEATQLLVIDAMAISRLIYRFPQVRNKIANLQMIGRLRTMPFFAALNIIELSFVADACKVTSFAKAEEIYKADETAKQIYLIDKGQVELAWDSGKKLGLGNGTAFGFADRNDEKIYGTPITPSSVGHSATAVCVVTLFQVERAVLLDIANLNPEQVGIGLRKERTSTMDRMVVFSKFLPEQRAELLGFMNYYHFADHHHLLMQQGEIADSMWILMPHRNATVVALDKSGKEVAKSLVSGPTYFNEGALRVQLQMDATIDAEPESRWLRLHWRDFQIFNRLHNGEPAEKLIMSIDADDLLGERATRARYSWLQEGERLVDFNRRHWVALLVKILLPLAITLILLLLWLALFILLPLSTRFNLVILGTIVFITLPIWLWQVADYMNDYLLITNRRVVRQEKVILINELRQSAFLKQVQNVDSAATFFGNILGYGDLTIQTAGATGGIVFDMVANPDRIKKIIFEERAKELVSSSAESKMVIQNLLEERLGLTLQMPSRVRSDEDFYVKQKQSRWSRYVSYLRGEQDFGITEVDTVTWRKHWFLLITKLFTPGLVTMVSIFAIFVLLVPSSFFGIPVAFATTGSALLFALVPIALFGFAWSGWVYADWRNDTYVITGNEIVDTEKKPLFFAEERRTARLDDIENVKLEIPSPIHYILNFGNVELQTAATDGDLTFDYVPNPRAVSEEIRRRIDSFSRQKELQQARQRAQELPDWFETYNRLDADRNPLQPGKVV